MSDKPIRIWLARDTKIKGGIYKVYIGGPPEAWQYRDGRWINSSLYLCSNTFHRAFPEVELNHGEGPIEVRFQVHEVRNGKLVME